MSTLRTAIWSFAGTKAQLDADMRSLGLLAPIQEELCKYEMCITESRTKERTFYNGKIVCRWCKKPAEPLVICSDCKNEVEETTHYEGQDLCHGCFFYATKV